MALHIILVNHVKAILVAERINTGIIGVMAGTDGIDIITLHRQDILQDFLITHGTACPGAKFMAVYALEDNALAIEAHQAAIRPKRHHLKPPETHHLGNHFHRLPLLILYFQQQLIQVRLFRAPKGRMLHKN